MRELEVKGRAAQLDFLFTDYRTFNGRPAVHLH